MSQANVTLFTVTAVLILDNDSHRILTNYYQPPHPYPHNQYANPYPTIKEQRTFEKGLFDKTHKQGTDIILFDNHVVVYKEIVDVIIYVVGGLNENESMLYQVLLALRDSLEILLKHSMDKRTIIDNYDLVSLAVDETVDDGIILETDPLVVATRVSRPPTYDANVNLDLSEQGLMNAYQFAKGKIAERLKQAL
ncbi:Longin-like domain-containing protein [Limtongia smithiae]|uniref:Longin-like domain-containing protein n=1 Tax=Limtongia smithiae TaxID=1125753 RepID=UPI0034D011E8